MTPATPHLDRRLCTMIFVDVVGYSKLKEEHAPSFFVSFLGTVARLLEAQRDQPLIANTWGDGLFVAYADIVQAAGFASSLLLAVETTDWKAFGLPRELSVRVGLHAGPVYTALDPVIGKTNVFGSHVTRAARIEPITPPGCAYASEQFAAALAAVTGNEFACDYVGRQTLAKNADNCILYRLRRR